MITKTWGQAEDYSQELANLTKNLGNNPTNEHSDDGLEGLLPCDLFLKNMIMITRRDIAKDVIQVRKSPLHLTWMITMRLYLKLCAMTILHALHIMPNIWIVGTIMISLRPIFFKRIVTIIRRMKIARDLVLVMNTLSYLT